MVVVGTDRVKGGGGCGGGGRRCGGHLASSLMFDLGRSAAHGFRMPVGSIIGRASGSRHQRRSSVALSGRSSSASRDGLRLAGPGGPPRAQNDRRMAASTSACGLPSGARRPIWGQPAPSPVVIASERWVGDVFAERGMTCIRAADMMRRRLTDQELQTLADAAAATDIGGGWLDPDKDALAPGQVYLGSFDAAAEAYGGEIVGPASDQWIIVERANRLLALSLAPIDLANGRTTWVVVGSVESVDCQ